MPLLAFRVENTFLNSFPCLQVNGGALPATEHGPRNRPVHYYYLASAPAGGVGGPSLARRRPCPLSCGWSERGPRRGLSARPSCLRRLAFPIGTMRVNRKRERRMAKGNLGAKFLLPGSVAILAATSSALANHDDHRPILKRFDEITTIASTVPANGDVKPYGVARVRRSVGNLRAGPILISNFNNSDNKQGTCTTIVDVAPDGQVAVFPQIDAGSVPGPCPGGRGLTT